MNAFHVIGGCTALWAVLVAFLGITREGFPATRNAERAVATISVALALGSISSAIITSANEKHDSGGEKAAAVLPGR